MSIRIKWVNEPITARSVSFFWFKRIYVGNKWLVLPPRVQGAVLAHERAHCDGHHTEWRLLALLFPFIARWLCHRQELQADAYATAQGFGPELLWLLRNDAPSGLFHPTNCLRREKLVHNKLFARST